MASEEEAAEPAGTSPTASYDTPIDCDSFPGSDESFEDTTSTMSVISSVRRFEKENGRTYHGYRAGLYYYPNDPSETERLEFQHHVLHSALQGKLHFAPLSSPATILDIGTGTGAWAIQMGDAYPHAIIEATDLSPIQPDIVPENVQFIIDDAEQEDWCVPEDHYDYIHTRIMMGCFKDFKTVIKRAFKHTKPGGWMESQDVMHPPFCDDGTMPDDWPFKEWSEYIEEAALDAERPLRVANKLKRWYTEAGFVDVQERVIKLPINTWPRDKALKVLGKWWCENMLMGLQGFSLALLSRVFGWSKNEIEVYLVNVRKAMTDRNVHAYHRYYIVWGRKPENPSDPSTDFAKPTEHVTVPQAPSGYTSQTPPLSAVLAASDSAAHTPTISTWQSFPDAMPQAPADSASFTPTSSTWEIPAASTSHDPTTSTSAWQASPGPISHASTTSAWQAPAESASHAPNTTELPPHPHPQESSEAPHQQ